MRRSIRPLARQEVREIDQRAARELGLPTLVLMENAGRGAAAWLSELAAGFTPEEAARPFSAAEPASTGEPMRREPVRLPRILIVCGSGNNGGDGGVVARHLDAWGFPVQVVWFANREKLSGDAGVQWDILTASGIDHVCWPQRRGVNSLPAELDALIAGADWVVDGLLGTGLTRPVEGMLRTVIEAINRSDRPVLALDLPSGLDTDTGIPLGVAVRARATATFVAPKLGFTVPGASQYTGRIAVIDIGVPRKLLVASG